MPTSTIARLGGLTRAATHDGVSVTDRARSTFRDSFLAGHGCSVCPRREIPEDLPLTERTRRANALRKAHYIRIATLPRSRRMKKAAPEVAPGTATRGDGDDDQHLAV